jgi:hypothetical protein
VSGTVTTHNTTIAIADSFNDLANWVQVLGTPGDLISIEGNTIGSKYVVISKDPLTENTSTTLTSVASFSVPVELAFGAHMSQRTIGQEFSIELVSTETPLTMPADIAIATISQTTTTLTVNTSAAHGLRMGTRIGVYGVPDSRVNYSSLTVATVPTLTSFTATAGQNGTIPSITASSSGGFVTIKSTMSDAPNGVCQLFDGTTATQASFYVRAGGTDPADDVFSSGTVTGDHRVTVGTTASIQPINGVGAYSFQPTNEYRATLFPEKLQWSDSTVDSTTEATSRFNRTQIVPDPSKTYKLKLCGKSLRSLTRPVAQIVSVSKSGGSTATVTTDFPHGLTNNDQIVAYGVRDTTNFANRMSAITVATTPTSTTFTLVWGSASTVTSYGGYVARMNGGQVMQGALTMVAQSISRTDNIVTVVGSATWSGALIGDMVNLVGIRDNVTGASLDYDGPYRVRNMDTTSLVLEPVGNAPMGEDLGSANCGGAVIRRTDLRISFARLLPFARARVEGVGRPTSDSSQALPVAIKNVPAVTVTGTISTVFTVNACTLASSIVGDISSGTTVTTVSVNTANVSTSTFAVSVTAVTGTNPTLDIVVQETVDNLFWYDIYHFERFTGVTNSVSPPIRLHGQFIRYVRTAGGTSPLFTHAVFRQVRQIGAPTFRRIFDRAILPNTLNSTTATMICEGCDDVQLIQSSAAGASVAPVFSLEGSETESEWYSLGDATVTGTASTTSSANYSGAIPKFVRARVSTAGTGAVLSYVALKAKGA